MRPEKEVIVAEVRQRVAGSPYVLLTDYTRLTVDNFSALRKRLAGAGAECHVVKNTMLQRALTAAGFPAMSGPLTGMTAMVIGNDQSEVTAVAKILKQFAKETEKPKIKLGYMGRQALRPEEVAALAELPSREALRAGLIGLLQAPATRIAVVVAAPAGQIARVLKARADKNQEAATPPATAGAAV